MELNDSILRFGFVFNVGRRGDEGRIVAGHGKNEAGEEHYGEWQTVNHRSMAPTDECWRRRHAVFDFFFKTRSAGV